jgi:hypothetical protein
MEREKERESWMVCIVALGYNASDWKCVADIIKQNKGSGLQP